jgi:hypothetical protein
LALGEVKPVQIVSDHHAGDVVPQLHGELHRVGVGDLADVIGRWADEIGITAIMNNYTVGGNPLPKGGEQRFSVNDGTWWCRRFPPHWESNMHYCTPDDDEANAQFMNALSSAGFDAVVSGLGSFFNLKSLTLNYPSFIAVSKCSSSFMHSDSNFEGLFNLIFHTNHSVIGSPPELNLGDWSDPSVIVPYGYEKNAGILLGRNGMHGTAPVDYTDSKQMRMVASVYMVDTTIEDTFDGYMDDWVEEGDPPYPGFNVRENTLRNRIHWRKDEEEFRVGMRQWNASAPERWVVGGEEL